MMDMMDLKGLHYELLMNSFSNRTILLLSEETSFASHSLFTSWHFKLLKSCNTIFCEQERGENKEILVPAFVNAFLFWAEKERGFVTRS